MKIVIVDNYYPEFLRKVEAKISQNHVQDYYEIKNDILSYNFGTSDYYSKNLKSLNVGAEDIIINSKLLQNTWSRKNNLPSYFISLLLEKLPKVKNIYENVGNPLVLLAQIKKLNPDVVYIQCVGALPPLVTKIIKSRCKLLVGQIASMPPPDSYFKNYDLILSSLPNLVEAINKLGVRSEYFPIAFEATLLQKLVKSPIKKYNITHIGGYGPVHNERNKILEYAARKVKIDFWGYGINNLEKGSPILRNYHGEAWGLEMYEILRQSKITLTGHITKVAGDYANNMTLFEATGCGTMLITDYKSNLHELFDINKEIVTYRSPGELVKKIKYYLTHENERNKIALAGQKKTLKDHTYLNRMKLLIKILERHLVND